MDRRTRGKETANQMLKQAIVEKGDARLFKEQVGRRSLLKVGAGLGIGAVLGANSWFPLRSPVSYAQTADTIVVRWNNATLQAIRFAKPGPTVTARALAVVHTCMYHAWAVYDPVANTCLSAGPKRRPKGEYTVANKNMAMSYAAYRALLNLFPAQATTFATMMQSMGYNPNETTLNVATPAGIGNFAAMVYLQYRQYDGANQSNNYADTSNYVPTNTPDTLVDPNLWQPLRLPNGTVQKFTTPHWGTVVPFALVSGSQFRPSGPYRMTDTAYYKEQASALLTLSANLDDQTKAISEYWSDGPSTEFPPGHWALFAQFAVAQLLSSEKHNTVDADVKLFFTLSNALLDASIAAWDCKRAYNSVRPISAIRYLYAGKQVAAWGGPGLGARTLDGKDWMPYQQANVVTPSFPEYVSGHSTFSAAGAYVIRQFLNSDVCNDSFVVKAGSSLIEPNMSPTQSVTLSWPTFSSAAEQAGLSRRYGGIHFEKGDLDGRKLGEQVGKEVWGLAQAFITGSQLGR